jgi:hypothetical protein
MINVELVNGGSYATLKKHFKKGEVYALGEHDWENLRLAQWPDGKPVFALSDKGATHTPTSTDNPDVVKGDGITITHNIPQPMTRAEAEKAGLGSFFRRDAVVEGDTGAALQGTGGEADDYQGPSGHEGLDEDEGEVTVGAAQAPVETPAETAQAPQSAQPAPAKVTPKAKPVVITKGGKSGPSAPKADDVIKV